MVRSDQDISPPRRKRSHSRSRSRSPPRRHDRRRSPSPRRGSPRRDRRRSRSPRRGSPPKPSERDRIRENKARKMKRRQQEEEEDLSHYEFGTGRKRSESEERQHQEEEAEKKRLADRDREKPNFELSGKLSEEARTTATGAILKFVEPADAKIPKKGWVLFPFKGDDAMEPIRLESKQTYYLFGRDRTVADIPVDHPSCSKQHAVLQFRGIEVEDPETLEKRMIVKPYIIDLQSTNGTYLNKTRIEDSRYYEVKPKDVLKFGFSSRDYVVLNEQLIQDK